MTDKKEIYSLLKYQLDLFAKVAEVMTKVDLPRLFWDETLARMQKELEACSPLV